MVDNDRLWLIYYIMINTNTEFIPPSVNQLQRDGDQPLSSRCFPAADVGAIAMEVVSTSKPARGALMVASSGWSQVMIEDS